MSLWRFTYKVTAKHDNGLYGTKLIEVEAEQQADAILELYRTRVEISSAVLVKREKVSGPA